MHQVMTTRIARTLAAAGLAVLLVNTSPFAEQTVARIRGEITKVDGDDLTIKARDGAELKVKLANNLRVMSLVKASLADIKPNAYIGVTAMPEPDGSQRAIAIHLFTEGQRGTAEGFRPWDLRPNSTMTNGAVETTVAGVDGQVLTVKYKQGYQSDEKKVVVPKDATIVAYAPGDKSELKPGAQIIIFAATK